MSADTANDAKSDTYVGFDMNDPEDKRQLKIEAAKRDYSSMAAFVRDIVYDELELDQDASED